MLTRWSAIKLLDDMPHHQRIPLFIEVREITEEQFNMNLDEAIFSFCRSSESSATLMQFQRGLRSGMFVVILDGVDEVPFATLPAFLIKLKRLKEQYPQSPIVASARPGTQLPNLTNFAVAHVQPMSLSQVVHVLDKAPYDEERKNILINELKGGLFEKHISFLSNPLLVTIMLITFDDAARVPSQISTFYAEAFEALFKKHDWAKGIYIRERRTGLEIEQFAKIFKNFCYASYLKQKFTFLQSELGEYIRRSVDQTKLDCRVEDFIDDCIVSVCLLQIDEPYITFVHRSFQEYFTAHFISSFSGPNITKMITFTVDRATTDNTYKMLCQMNPEMVMRHWAIPLSSAMISDFKLIPEVGSHRVAKTLEFLGISAIVVHRKTLDVEGWTLDDNANLNSIDCILSLASEDGRIFPITNPLPETLNAEKLPEKFLNLLTRDPGAQFVTITRAELSASWVDETPLKDLPSSVLATLIFSHRQMLEAVERADEFAVLLDWDA